MSASRQFLIEGLDPTGLECISKEDLLTMIRNAAPAAGIGYIIVGENTPSIAANPEYATFLWLKMSTREVFHWTGTEWARIRCEALIPNKTISKDKLIGDGNPFMVFRVSSDGQTVELVPALSLFSNNTIPHAYLHDGPNGFYVLGNDPTNRYIHPITFSGVIQYGIPDVPNNTIPWAKINPPSFSGDITGVVPSATLVPSGVTPGTYGTATKVPRITVDSKGRITAITEQDTPQSQIATGVLIHQENTGSDGTFDIDDPIGPAIPFNVLQSYPAAFFEQVSNGLKITTAGRYLIEGDIFIHYGSMASNKKVLIRLVRNTTTETVVSAFVPNANNLMLMVFPIRWSAQLAVNDVLKVTYSGDAPTGCGLAANIAPYPERYSTLKVTYLGL